MKINELKSQWESLKKFASSTIETNYRFGRDKNCNLRIYNSDNEIINKIPTLPFRTYQTIVQQKLFQENIKRFLLVWPRRSGKEVTSFNILIQSALTRPGLYLM